MTERGGDAEDAVALANDMGLRVRSFRQEHAAEAARLRPLTRHLGLDVRLIR